MVKVKVATGMRMNETVRERKKNLMSKIKNRKISLSPGFNGISKIIIDCSQWLAQILNEFQQPISFSADDLKILKAQKGKSLKWLRFSSFNEAINAIRIIEKKTGRTFYKTHRDRKYLYFIEHGYSLRQSISMEERKTWNRDILRSQ